MAFLDQMPLPGMMGLASRPKTRALDRLLQAQRNKEQSQIQENVAAPETSSFSGLNRPGTLALLLGGGK